MKTINKKLSNYENDLCINMFFFFSFPKQVESGLIEVISPSEDFYPNLNDIPLTYGDTKERVK